MQLLIGGLIRSPGWEEVGSERVSAEGVLSAADYLTPQSTSDRLFSVVDELGFLPISTQPTLKTMIPANIADVKTSPS